MKKLFGGKKKKKSKPASFNSTDSDLQVKDVVPRKLILSQSTDHPRLSVISGTSNDNDTISNTISNSNTSKGLMHSKSQGIMKTAIPTQPAMIKRLNRPTSSPPALIMPRPRYAEPPTRAVLKSFEHEKTLLDLDPAHGQPQERKPLLRTQNGMDNDNSKKRDIHGNNNDNNPSAASLSIKLPIPITNDATSSRPQQLTSITDTDHSPPNDTKPKKSLESGIAAINAKKHESLNSVTGSDDSNRVYESALESPMMTSTSTTTTTTVATTLHHHDHSQTASESIFAASQPQRHSSPSAFGGPPFSQLIPPTASDSSETVTPAGSTRQRSRTLAPEQPSIVNVINSIDLIKPAPQYPTSDHASTPATTGRPPLPILTSSHDTHHTPDKTVQPLDPSQDLESLQQQVLLIQQQREMDRVEYERMEQIHKERTKWMKAEIDRTQSKLLELTASKRACMSSQLQYGGDLPHTGGSMANNHYDGDGDPKGATLQREQRQEYEQHHSSTNTTPSRSQKFTKTGTNPTRLSRSSSKTSNGGRSSSSGAHPNYRSKDDSLQHPDKLTREKLNEQNNNGSLAEDGIVSEDQAAYINGTQSENLSRQSSGRRSHQSQQSRLHRYQQQMQDLPPSQQQQQQQTSMTPSTPKSRHREQRPRSKSTESRMPPQPPIDLENDYYSDPYDETPYGRPPSRPQSNNSRRRHRQRSVSAERLLPYYYGIPYFAPPDAYGDGMNDDLDDGADTDDNGEQDMDNYHYMDMEYRYPPLHQQQQMYDSFPPHHRHPMRHYYPQTPYMPGPMNFMSPPQIQPSMSSGPPPIPPYNHRQRMTAPRMNMEMQQQQEFYGFDTPTSYYTGAPSSRRRQSQTQRIPPPPGMAPNDDGFWPHSTNGGGGGPSSFNRYPLPPAMPPYMQMDDPQRRTYWRSRPPPPSEYAM